MEDLEDGAAAGTYVVAELQSVTITFIDDNSTTVQTKDGDDQITINGIFRP